MANKQYLSVVFCMTLLLSACISISPGTGIKKSGKTYENTLPPPPPLIKNQNDSVEQIPKLTIPVNQEPVIVQEASTEFSPEELAAILEDMIANGEDISEFFPETAAGGRPVSHTWEYLKAYGVERTGYGVYSYVLFAQENNDSARALYFELVDLIQASTVSAQSLPAQAVLGKFNVFLIPADTHDSENHKPDYELSRLLLATLASTSQLNLEKQGPFIISLSKPLSFGEQGDQLDILYVDLSNTPKAALTELVRTYKKHLVIDDIEGVEVLKSLRLRLLNYALIAEQNIGFAKAAYADLQKTFFE